MTEHRNTRVRRTFGAFIYAAMLYFALFWLGRDTSSGFGLVLLVYPFTLGIGGVLLLDPRGQMKFWPLAGLMLLAYLALCGVLFLLQIESVFCLVIGLPIFFLITLAAMAVTSSILGDVEKNTTLRAVTLGLPFLLMAVDFDRAFEAEFYTRKDVIEINATPEVVWAQITDFPTIAPEERIWTFTQSVLGGPLPVRAEMEGTIRHAIWTDELRYEERLTLIDAPNAMDWDIAFAPGPIMAGHDPDIHPASAQFTLLRGRYRLEPHQGGTRLILETDYRLATLWNGYVTLWGDRFLSDNQRSILHVIKLRAEAAPRSQ